MSKINWTRLTAMEGDEETVALFPFHASLLIKLLFFLEDHPQEFIEEDIEDIGIDNIEDVIDDIQNRLASI